MSYVAYAIVQGLLNIFSNIISNLLTPATLDIHKNY